MKALLTAVGSAVLLMGCAQTEEDLGPPPPAADPMSPLSAPGFAAMAGSSDLFEIESSRLALERSRNPAVRSFAQMMIDHHTRTTQDMMAAAQRAGLNLPPPTMLPPQAAALERVRSAGMSDFDATYKREQIAGHEQALMLHQNYASGGDLPAFRDVATRTVPIIQQHLSQAQGLPDYAPPPPPAAPVRAGERG